MRSPWGINRNCRGGLQKRAVNWEVWIEKWINSLARPFRHKCLGLLNGHASMSRIAGADAAARFTLQSCWECPAIFRGGAPF